MQGAGAMNEGGHGHPASFEARHAAIIARTLGWADEAAERSDYVEALRWVETIRSLGRPLPHDYEAKRQAWLTAADRCEATSGQTAPRRRGRRRADQPG